MSSEQKTNSKLLECTNIYNECENNISTGIRKDYTVEDIKNIWEQLSAWIVGCLKNSKSVIIKQLGLFTLSKWALDTGIRKEFIHSKPIFVLSRTLQDDFYIYQIKHFIDNKVPVAIINYCNIAKQCNCTKETVESSLDEVTKCIRRVLYENRDLMLEMPNLGKLTIIKGVAEFVFTNECLANHKEPEPQCHRAKSSSIPYRPLYQIPCKSHSSKQTMKDDK